MNKMSDAMLLAHLVVFGLAILAFLALLVSPRPLVRRLGLPRGGDLWLLGLALLAGAIIYLWYSGTEANGFLD